jgi:hypothetical protein
MVRARLLLLAVVGVTLTHAHIIRLDAGESECLYEEFGVEHLLEGEDQQTVPTEVALAFIVRAHTMGGKTISNPVSVNASDPYGNVLVQKSGVHEEVRLSTSGRWCSGAQSTSATGSAGVRVPSVVPLQRRGTFSLDANGVWALVDGGPCVACRSCGSSHMVRVATRCALPAASR